MSDGTRQRGKVVIGRNQPPVPQNNPTPNNTGTPPNNAPRRVWVNQTRQLVGLQVNQQIGNNTPQIVNNTNQQVQQSPRVEKERDELKYNSLKLRLETVGAWMNEVKQTNPEVVNSMFERFKSAATALKEDDYGLASGQLDKLEYVIDGFNEQVLNSLSSETSDDTTQPTTKVDPEELRERLHKLGEIVKSNSEHPKAPIMRKAFAMAFGDFKNEKYGDCEVKVKKLESVIGNLPISSGKTTSTVPQVQPQGVSTSGTTNVNVPQVQPQGVSVEKSEYDNSKQSFEQFKNNQNAGWQTTTAKQKIQSIKSELLKIITDEEQAEDDIQRKGIIFDSKDKDYKKNVTKLVKDTMYEVLSLAGDPTDGTVKGIKLLESAMDKLAEERVWYADVRGIKDDKMLDQRKRKTQAIEGHIREMKTVNAKLREVLKLKMQPALDLLAKLPALNTQDPAAGKEAIKELGVIMGDETMRENIFQTAGVEHCDALYQILDGQQQNDSDKFCRHLALTRASDSTFMDAMSKHAILAESGKAQRNTFFRGNSTATKLATNYAQNSPEGKIYCKNVHAKYSELAKGKGTLEMDPEKIFDKKTIPTGTDPYYEHAPQKEKERVQKIIQKNSKSQTDMVSDVVDEVTNDPTTMPPEIAKICGIFYDEAKRVSGDDEDFATTQSGGFLALRVLCPALTTKAAYEINDINEKWGEEKKVAKEKWVKEGKDAKKFEPPPMNRSDKSLLEEKQQQQRLVTLQSKLLQNMSNGMTFEKEPFMQVMDPLIGDQNDYGPVTKKFRKFFKDVALHGKTL